MPVSHALGVKVDLPPIEKATLEPLPFASLTGWQKDDHAKAFAAFYRTCMSLEENTASLRQQNSQKDALRAVCKAALQMPVKPDTAMARQFFEHHFRPYQVIPHEGAGFLTGYYEPEFAGRLIPGDGYDTPLLARPDDLVTIADGEMLPGLDTSLRGARRIMTPAGEAYEAFPDRAAIEDGALGEKAGALVYLDRVDAFMAHIQGSVRVRLPDGMVRRFAYAGRNGHAYTSVARLIVEKTGIAPKDLTAPKLVEWLRTNAAEGRRLMRENRSYIFFRHADELKPDQGPIGGASVQLEPARSIAIDQAIWPYGLPFWIEAQLPHPAAPDDMKSWNRLMIAQDTGSAIIGPARADIFIGSGKEAGLFAGIIRHAPERFIVLLPVSMESDG